MKVNSKGAADQCRYFELHKLFELCGNVSDGCRMSAHPLREVEEIRVVCANPRGERYMAKTALHSSKNPPYTKSRLIVLNTLCAAPRIPASPLES